MARGKIPIKKIENATNRQVTYSKRRKGLFKKAYELSVLCDAKVSVIMISTTSKAHVYTSPSISTKDFYDMYQKITGVDLWCACYEKMKEDLRRVKELNMNLDREIRRRMGECLDGLNFAELCSLEEKMEDTAMIVRERQMKLITSQTDNIKKKIRNSDNVNKILHHEFELRGEDPNYIKVELRGDHKSVLGLSTALHGLLALNLQQNQPNPSFEA